MRSIQCSDVFIHLIDQSRSAPQSPAIIEHVESCSTCQVRLLALFQLLGAPQFNAHDCATCLDQLDAFVDEEVLDPVRAMRWYPAVWTHLWVCAECLESYDMLKPLAAAPQPSLQPSVRSTDVGLVRLRRRAVQAALPAATSFRSLYGQEDDAYQLLMGQTSIGEQTVEHVIKVRKIASDRWLVMVVLNPALDYTVTLVVDDYVASARLDPAGVATMELPKTYVDNAYGGDWLIGFAPAED